jgi:hypothetical protein
MEAQKARRENPVGKEQAWKALGVGSYRVELPTIIT